jgi:hypothetical protein
MKIALLSILLISFSATLFGQGFVANYDESKMPSYSLPDPLIFNNGLPVKNKNEWKKRRIEIVDLFENEVYGKTPAGKVHLSSKVLSENLNAFNGKAIRKEVQLKLEKDGEEVLMNVLIYLPKSEKPVPLFLANNFHGNHTVSKDPEIAVTTSWLRSNTSPGNNAESSAESRRGTDASS